MYLHVLCEYSDTDTNYLDGIPVTKGDGVKIFWEYI